MTSKPGKTTMGVFNVVRISLLIQPVLDQQTTRKCGPMFIKWMDMYY
jgi:hypothetical protein